jgi:hypothetical protein
VLHTVHHWMVAVLLISLADVAKRRRNVMKIFFCVIGPFCTSHWAKREKGARKRTCQAGRWVVNISISAPPPSHHLLPVVVWWIDLACCLKLLTVRHFCIDNRIAPEKSKKKCYIYRLLLLLVPLSDLNGRHTSAIKQNENVTHVVLLLRVSSFIRERTNV